MRFSNELIFVTGADGALGGGLAREFRQAGADVVAITRTQPKDPIDGVRYAHADLTQEDTVAELFNSFGAPWAVVNTVGGYAPPGSWAKLDITELNQQFTLNLVTAAVLTKYAVAAMTSAGRGRIVHTASEAANPRAKAGFTYSVSKAGVVHLVQHTARELAGTGVTINAVSPTIIDTPANRNAMPQADHAAWPTPADLAPDYIFLTHPGSTTNGAVLPA